MKKTIALGAVVLLLMACSRDSSYQGGGRGVPDLGGDPAATDEEPEVPPDPAFDDDEDDPVADPGETP